MARTTKAQEPYQFDDAVPLSRIFLALNNPRFEPVETENEAIEKLCSKEEVLALAKDIVRHGISPLEQFALIKIPGRANSQPSYFVQEGNRRICALKLLGDPDLAPANLRKSFEKLAESWNSVRTVRGVVFKDQSVLRVWLDRTHSGQQGGIGRRNWDSDQKQRFSGVSKNKLAQDLLDYAESQKFISKAERKGKLTTVARFLNDVFREVLGIDQSNPDELSRNRPKADFDAMLIRFLKDLLNGEKVNSRKNRSDVIAYARELGAMPGLTNTRIEPETLGTSEKKPSRGKTTKKPKQVASARHITYDSEVADSLRALGNEKLERLYYSICQLELADHTLLVCIGAWAFFETLTACQGRSGQSFPQFLQKTKLESLGIGADTRSERTALERISEFGNTTKHHPVSATFNGSQLNNDMTTLKDVIMACIADAS